MPQSPSTPLSSSSHLSALPPAQCLSYTLTLLCGCTVYVSRDPRTGLAHTRIVERRGTTCRTRRHVVGARVWLWELLPDPSYTTQPVFVGDADSVRPASA